MQVEVDVTLRPCMVGDKKSLFHRWCHVKKNDCTEYEVAIVEYEDGSVDEVLPSRIRFCDSPIREYAFNE